MLKFCFYFMLKSFLCFLDRKGHRLINDIYSIFVHIQANQNPDFFNILHRQIQSEKATGTKITNKNIKKLCIIFQNN